MRDITFAFDQDNFCEKDLDIACEGDCKACPNFEYFRIWDMVKPMAGQRPDFIVIEMEGGKVASRVQSSQ